MAHVLRALSLFQDLRSFNNRRLFWAELSPMVPDRDQGQPWLAMARQIAIEESEQSMDDEAAEEYQWMLENGYLD